MKNALLLSLALTAVYPASLQAQGRWEVVELVDEMTDEVKFSLVNLGEGGNLSFSCSPEGDGYFVMFMPDDMYMGEVEVQWRFDSDAAEEPRIWQGAGPAVISFGDQEGAEALVKRAFEGYADRLLVRLKGSRGSSDLTFGPDGIVEGLRRLGNCEG